MMRYRRYWGLRGLCGIDLFLNVSNLVVPAGNGPRTMYDDTGGIEEHAADVVGVGPVVLSILSTAVEGIKERGRIWGGSWHTGHGLDRSCVWRACFSKVGVHDVIVAAIGLAVHVLGTTVRERWVLKVAPQAVDLSDCELLSELAAGGKS